nr:KilA-N domain-containing protein [uncultured Undibacterium sp.]
MPAQQSFDFIHHEANGAIIDQRAADGYINATAMCRAVGKQINDYARLKATGEFLVELSAETGIPVSDLVHSYKGGSPHSQGTWVHPDIAVNLAQWLSPKFAVQVSKWVREWLSDTKSRTAHIMPYHLQRHMDNFHKVPATHFSILQEMTITLIGPLEAHGYSLPERLLPDISQGKMFCSFLRKHGMVDPATLPKYEHTFPDGRKVEAKLYPIHLLGAFREFIASTWMPQRSVAYFADRDAKAIPYLEKVLRLEAPANSSMFRKIA